MNTGSGTVIKTGETRVFLIENRAGPENVPAYQAAMRAMATTRPYGDITPIQVPDPDQWNAFEDVDQIRGEKGRITIPLQAKYQQALSALLGLAEKGCAFDVHVPIGSCKDPQNLNLGWDVKKLIFEDVFITTHSLSELGALQSADQAQVMEDVDASARIRYEIKRLLYQEQAESEAVQEVLDIRVCDGPQCGACGLPSDGCQVVVAVTLSAGGSPGLSAEILATSDGGATWVDRNITTLAANEDPNELACVNGNVVVISEDSSSIHWANLVDILDEVEVWAEVTSGFVVANGPLAIHSASPTNTWITGEGGYIYFSSDPTNGVEVQTAGTVTTQNLLDIHGVDLDNLVAVGALNAVLVTDNGGETWQAVTGPAVGISLNTVFMRSVNEWWVGTAGGALWYTLDGGENWTQKRFSGDNAGSVRHILFVTDSVGFMAHTTAAPLGRIFRTDDGGYSWYLDSQATNKNMPDNDRINRIAGCGSSVPQVKANTIYAGGLAGDAIDGIIIKGA